MNTLCARTDCRLRLILAAVLAVFASTAAAQQAPREAVVTREAQDLYRAGVTNPFYLKTVNCHEQIFGDRVTFRWNVGTNGGVMIRRGTDKMCYIEKVLREVNIRTMQPITSF